MANSRDIIKKAVEGGAYVPQELIDSAYGMHALTDKIAEKNFLDRYGSAYLLKDADPVTTFTVPTLVNILDKIPKAEDDKRSKYRVFVDDMPKKMKEWKALFEKDPEWGEDGWKTVVSEWKRASHDAMMADIAKARKAATDDGLYAKYASLMFPRATEHIGNTGNFTTKDILMDLGENLAMSVPGAAFTGIAGKGVARVAPRVFQYFSGPGRNIAEGALKGAGRMSGNILGNAVVPFASEAADAAVYGDNDTGMEHRADFSLGDAAMGTAINQGVNRGLMRLMGPMVDRFSQNGLARGGMLKARQFLEQLGQSFKKKGDDFANAARVANEVDNIRFKGGILPEEVEIFGRGGEQVAANTSQQARDAFTKATVLDAIDRGNIDIKPRAARDAAAEEYHRGVLDAIAKKSEENAEAIAKAEQKSAEAFIEGNREQAEKMMEEAVKRQEEQMFLDNAARKNYRQLEASTAFNFNGNGDAIRNATLNGEPVLTLPTIFKTIDNDMPEFVNYAKWHGAAGPDAEDIIKNALNQSVPSWIVNKVGKDADGEIVLASAPGIKKALKENREKVHDAPRKRRASEEILSIVSEPGDLDERDRKYLNAIAENPDIMTVGYAPDRTGFNMWLLERGNRLLQGTSAYRPAFVAE